MYEFDFSYIVANHAKYLDGLVTTAQLAGLVILCGTLLGVPLAGLLFLPRVVTWPLRVLVEMGRAIPELVWIFFIYFFPYKQIFGISPFSPFWSAFIALTIVLTLFCGVLYRSAIEQVPRAQAEGLRALGLPPGKVLMHVHLPYVARSSIPALVAYWIGILKMTSLASIIGVVDVVFVARVGMAQNARALEAWLVVALAYVILVVPTTLLLRWVEGLDFFQRQ